VDEYRALFHEQNNKVGHTRLPWIRRSTCIQRVERERETESVCVCVCDGWLGWGIICL
jgi:hypothetical protein